MNSLKRVPFNLLHSTLTSATTNCCKSLRLPCVKTQSSVRCYASTYEGDGKTTANVINMDQTLGLMIHSYSPHGFRLNTDVFVKGSMALFPNTALSWQVESIDEITEESLSIFPILDPGIDIAVIGYGDADLITQEKRARISNIMKKFRIPVEILPTDAACTTFNFLVAESRFAGAVLIPQKKGYDYIKEGLEKFPDEHGILS